jgi:DNA-binding winged helix-turn-helix (wHTH) protein
MGAGMWQIWSRRMMKMTNEIELEHPFTYRQEVLHLIFSQIGAGGSAVLIGASSMGKSRLLHFMMRRDVVAHYLGEREKKIVFIWVDHHRLATLSEWAFYELILTALVETTVEHHLSYEIRQEISGLRDQVIMSQNGLQARRNVELAVKYLCDRIGYQLCFLLDEFDQTYKNLPATALTNLRALRDRFKYQINFILLMRDKPERLREPRDHEGFYELYSRNQVGLKPYQVEDAQRVLHQLAARKTYPLSKEINDYILKLSGGHPGLLVALFGLARKQAVHDWEDWCSVVPQTSSVVEECRKIWLGLGEDERLALNEIAHGVQVPLDNTIKVLQLKGLIKLNESSYHIFSPLMATFVRQENPAIGLGKLTVDKIYSVIRVGRREIDVTPLEFALINYFVGRDGEVCKREDILAHLYPEEEKDLVVNDNRVDSLVRHLRGKIEKGSPPRYLLTVRGMGYRMVTNPDQQNN